MLYLVAASMFAWMLSHGMPLHDTKASIVYLEPRASSVVAAIPPLKEPFFKAVVDIITGSISTGVAALAGAMVVNWSDNMKDYQELPQLAALSPETLRQALKVSEKKESRLAATNAAAATKEEEAALAKKKTTESRQAAARSAEQAAVAK